MNDPPEFIVVGITTGVSGVFHLIGRVGDHTLHVGDSFDQLDEPEGSGPVTITIQAMQAYGRHLSSLSGGMTGTIDVTGEGVNRIRPGCVLVSNMPAQKPTEDSHVSHKA